MSSSSRTTLEEIDRDYEQLGCLGHGGFGSVFLAKKRSGTLVALKMMRSSVDQNQGDIEASLDREVDTVLHLTDTEASNNRNNNDNKDLSIVYFKNWFKGPNFSCIVMQYANGGSLADEIVSKRNKEPYAERRIASYTLQLADALAYAHQKGVYHYDVKSANILIDRSNGGKLLLADFGNAVWAGETVNNVFTDLYAAPELLDASARDDFSRLSPEKIDAFGIGCILFEMICCRKLVDLTGEGETLSQYIVRNLSMDAALNSDCVRLPWTGSAPVGTPSYSDALKKLIKKFIDPNPQVRWAPSDAQKPLRSDPLSPLLSDYVSASVTAQPNDPLTIDNIQLGMFVWPGTHFDDSGSGVANTSVGVVVKLDPDAGYTDVAFPTAGVPARICCRIGAGDKFELQVGPTSVPDFVSNSGFPKRYGIVHDAPISSLSVGQRTNSNCIVVGLDNKRKLAFVVPAHAGTLRGPTNFLPRPPIPFAAPRVSLSVPPYWGQTNGLFTVSNSAEETRVLEKVFADSGGFDIQACDVISIQRNQDSDKWVSYARTRDQIAHENWGISNEALLFHATTSVQIDRILGNQSRMGTTLTKSVLSAHRSSEARADGSSAFGVCRLILARVALGRSSGEQVASTNKLHSIRQRGTGNEGVVIFNQLQAYPEYVISYRCHQLPGRRVVRANRDPRRVPTPTARDQHAPRPHQVNQSSSSAAAAAPSPFSFSASVASRQPSPISSSFPRAPPIVPSSTVAAKAAADAAKAAVSANNTDSPSSANEKLCVICMERPVNHILIPCGHPCLCSVCSTGRGIRMLRNKCPECRQPIQMTNRIYGKIIEN